MWFFFCILEKYDGDVLTNVAIYADTFYIPLIFGQLTYRVKADVMKAQDKVSSLGETFQKDVSSAQKIMVVAQTDQGYDLVEAASDSALLKTIQ